MYKLYFVVKDNDGKYDLDDTLGLILDPTVIDETTASSLSALPTSISSGGGGGGGCFIQSLLAKDAGITIGSFRKKLMNWLAQYNN